MSYGKVTCPPDPLIIATFGQSNHANFVKPKYPKEFPQTFYQYDWKSGSCFRYKEPLLGTQGVEGNSVTHALIEITRHISVPVVVVPYARGKSSVEEWATGYLVGQHEYVMAHLKRKNLSPDIFLWHQGETDNMLYTKEKNEYHKVPYFKPPEEGNFSIDKSQEYEEMLDLVVSRTQSFSPESYFGIAYVSRCNSKLINYGIRNAQSNIANKYDRTFISADSDSIWGEGKRYDECHFTQEGAQELSTQYVESITPLLKRIDNIQEVVHTKGLDNPINH